VHAIFFRAGLRPERSALNPTDVGCPTLGANVIRFWKRKNDRKADDERDEKEMLANIKMYGWHVMQIPQDDEGPGFAYSIGLFQTFSHSEIIIVGLPGPMMVQLINEIGERVRTGERLYDGIRSHEVLAKYPVMFRSVPEIQFPHYFGWARWYYKGDNFTALQMLYPDKDRHWPWDEGVSDLFVENQPVLANGIIPEWAKANDPSAGKRD
jgi:hypothetical protein